MYVDTSQRGILFKEITAIAAELVMAVLFFIAAGNRGPFLKFLIVIAWILVVIAIAVPGVSVLSFIIPAAVNAGLFYVFKAP